MKQMQSEAEILNKRCTSDAVRFFIEHWCTLDRRARCAIIKSEQGRGRQASPDSEKLDAGGVARHAPAHPSAL
ncbi:hypothetical protein ACVW1A_004821 [Bradyrhizobium sp. LB1.3]